MSTIIALKMNDWIVFGADTGSMWNGSVADTSAEKVVVEPTTGLMIGVAGDVRVSRVLSRAHLSGDADISGLWAEIKGSLKADGFKFAPDDGERGPESSGSNFLVALGGRLYSIDGSGGWTEHYDRLCPAVIGSGNAEARAAVDALNAVAVPLGPTTLVHVAVSVAIHRDPSTNGRVAIVRRSVGGTSVEHLLMPPADLLRPFDEENRRWPRQEERDDETKRE